MIIEIEQTSANGNNQFVFHDEGQVAFTARTPFYSPSATYIGGESFRKIELFLPNGLPFFYTDYNVVENIKSEIVPFKYMVTGSQIFNRFTVHQANGNAVGAFYYEQTTYTKGCVVIEYKGKCFFGYARAVGDRVIMSIYDGDIQIAQLTKPNKVANNLDTYMLHVIDGYEYLRGILSLYVVFYDYRLYNHNLQYIKNSYHVERSYSKTFFGYDDKVNLSFIEQAFGKDEAERIDYYVKNKAKKMLEDSGFNLKRFWLIFALGWGIGLIASIVAVVIVLTNIN